MSKLTLSQITAAAINESTGSALVEIYNTLANALQRDKVKRFADRATGTKRALALLDELKAVDDKFKGSTPAPAGKLSMDGASGKIKATPAPAPAPKAKAETAPTSKRRGTNLIPLGHEPQACREGSKQAILLDKLRRANGATMSELIEALSGGNKPWTEATVRSGFGWDLKNKGYGVRSEINTAGTERFFLVMPDKFPNIPAHTPLKTAKPKAHAGQRKLV